MRVRVIYNNDQTVSVIHPAIKSLRPDETEGEWLERVFAKATPEGSVYDDIDSSELPSREFRDAWRGEKGKPITVSQSDIKPDKKQELSDSIDNAKTIADLKTVLKKVLIH